MHENATDLTKSEESPQTRRERGPLHRKLHSHPVLAVTTKIVVTLVGGLVLLAGVIMIFTPGQGILAIVLGLAILATEYAWAERWLRKARDKAAEAKRRAEAMDPKVRRRRLLLAEWLFSWWWGRWWPTWRRTTGPASPSTAGTGCRAWRAGCPTSPACERPVPPDVSTTPACANLSAHPTHDGVPFDGMQGRLAQW